MIARNRPWLRLMLVAGLALVGMSARPAPTEIEVNAFQGGYGIDFFEECARAYEKLHPELSIKIVGHPRIWEKLRPRFASDDVPDLCWPGWGMNSWELAFGGKLRTLNDYLDEPGFDKKRPWKETFVPSLLSKCRYGDKTYFLPFNFEVFGWWYNKKMFERNRWVPPRTYEEMLALCDKIRAKHIAPITFTGRYPSYMLRGFYMPWAISDGGMPAYTAMQNLEPGAWKHPCFLKAAETVMEMKRKQNFQTGCVGMSHTESQLEFLVERVAMIPNGTWLYAEMKNMLPPDFEMEFIPCPVFEHGKGDPSLICAALDGTGWCIPSQAKHPREAVDFFKYLTAPENAKKWVETKGGMISVRDLGPLKAPPHLQNVVSYFDKASATWNLDVESWYTEYGTAMCDAMRDLYNEVLTPQQFVDTMEQLSQELRANKRIRKFKAE